MHQQARMVRMARDEIMQTSEDREQMFLGVFDLGGLAPDGDELIEDATDYSVENLALAVEVVEQRRLADAGAAGDHLERGAVVSGVGELLLGDGENLVVGIGNRVGRAAGAHASQLGLLERLRRFRCRNISSRAHYQSAVPNLYATAWTIRFRPTTDR